LETVGLVAFLCLPIYFAKVGKPIFGSIFLDTVGDALSPPELGKKGWGGCRSPELGKKGMGLELGHRPCHLRAGHGTVFWHEPKHGTHEIFWAMPARHEHEGRAVPRSRHGGLHGPVRILGRAWTGTARKWHVDTSTTLHAIF